MSKRVETTKRFRVAIKPLDPVVSSSGPPTTIPPLRVENVVGFTEPLVSLAELAHAANVRPRRVHGYASKLDPKPFFIHGGKGRSFILYSQARTLLARLGARSTVAVAPTLPLAPPPVPVPAPDATPLIVTPPGEISGPPGHQPGGRMGSGGVLAAGPRLKKSLSSTESQLLGLLKDPKVHEFLEFVFKPPHFPSDNVSYNEGRLVEYSWNHEVRSFLEFLLSRTTL